MSDTGGFGQEESGLFTPRMGPRTGMKMEVPGLAEATAGISALNTSIGELKTALGTLNTTSYQLTQGISKVMGTITSQATQATKAVQGLTGASGGSTGGAGSSTGGTAGAAIAAAGGASGGSAASFGIAQSMFSGVTSNLAQDVMMAPLRFMTSQISQNRQL